MARGRKPNSKILAFQQPVTANPSPAAKAPPMPEWLGDEARQEWHRVVPHLLAQGTIAESDLALLVVYVNAWQTYVQTSQQEAASGGPVVKSPSGYPVQSPFTSVKNAAAETMRKLLAEFGLSHLARQKLVTETKPKASKLDEFLSA